MKPASIIPPTRQLMSGWPMLTALLLTSLTVSAWEFPKPTHPEIVRSLASKHDAWFAEIIPQWRSLERRADGQRQDH